MYLSENQFQIIHDFLRSKPIEKAWLFGSYVRGEADEDSDVDLIIQVKKQILLKLGLDFFGWLIELEEKLGKEVDLVIEGDISTYVLPYVEKEKKLIYEKTEI